MNSNDDNALQQLDDSCRKLQRVIEAALHAEILALPWQVLKLYSTKPDNAVLKRIIRTKGDKQLSVYIKKGAEDLKIEDIDIAAIVARTNTVGSATEKSLGLDFTTSTLSFPKLHQAVKQYNEVLKLRTVLGTCDNDEVQAIARLRVPGIHDSDMHPATKKAKLTTFASHFQKSDALKQSQVGRAIVASILSVLTLGGYAIGAAIHSKVTRGTALFHLSNEEVHRRNVARLNNRLLENENKGGIEMQDRNVKKRTPK